MKEYIIQSGSVTEQNASALIQDYLKQNRFIYAVYTNHFFCGTEWNSADLHQLLELRIFDQNCEIRLRRLSVSEPFRWRYIDDTAFCEALAQEQDSFLNQFHNRTFDESHYLDVKYSDGKNYTAAGGGKYTLPIEGARKILLRNYLDYDETGIVQVSDFRLRGFGKE